MFILPIRCAYKAYTFKTRFVLLNRWAVNLKANSVFSGYVDVEVPQTKVVGMSVVVSGYTACVEGINKLVLV